MSILYTLPAKPHSLLSFARNIKFIQKIIRVLPFYRLESGGSFPNYTLSDISEDPKSKPLIFKPIQNPSQTVITIKQTNTLLKF
jgi:hypothetical protein